MAVKSFTDKEFGEIDIYYIKTARHIKIGLHVTGKLRATAPLRTPKMLIRQLVNTSRPSIRRMLEDQTSNATYSNGDRIGKRHALLVTTGAATSIKREKSTIHLTLASGKSASDRDVQQMIRPEVIKALRKEAKEYLPQRLALLSEKLGYSYIKVKLSHASTRWGSCSSSGTISLNIALMKLPFNLIDYVIIHELCHTKELNHSDRFWKLVEEADQDYRKHMSALKSHSPTI